MEVRVVLTFLIAGVISGTQGREVIDMVICNGSRQPHIIGCGSKEIIDIQSVTIAYVLNINQCSAESLIPVIGNIRPPCKRSQKTPQGTDGSEVYKKCHGQQKCSIDDSAVNQKQHQLSYACDTPPQLFVANVLWFNYTCVSVHKTSRRVALPPLEKEVRGNRIEIFNPYYPCDAPRGEYELTCGVTPHKTSVSGVVFFTVIPKLVEFPLAENPCDDHLYFRTDVISEVSVSFCNSKTKDVQIWNDDPFFVNGHQFFEVNYRIKPNGSGGRFWLQLEARHVVGQNATFVELSASCSIHGNIPQPPESCKPLLHEDTERNSSNIEKFFQTGSNTVIAVLAGAVGVVFIIIVIAIILGLKHKRYPKKPPAVEKMVQSGRCDYTEERYDIEQEHLNTQTEVSNQVQPATYYNTTSDTNTATGTETFYDETYEDVDLSKWSEETNTGVAGYDNATVICENNSENSSHSYDNSPTVINVKQKKNIAVYENVQESGPYEPLNRAEYQNIKNLAEYKFYTGLDNSKRHSKV